MNIKVSIIVPIYNVEKYLDRCVISLLNQTYENIEIILVDDGSPDNSPKMCDEYAAGDSRVNVVHKINGGLSDARNAGLEVATGDYILFLDSDDYVELNMIEKLLKVAVTNKSDVVVFGYYADFVDKDESLLSTRNFPSINKSYSLDSFNEIPLNSDMIGLLGYAWNKLYNSKVIKSNNMKFTKGISLVEDMVFNGPVLMKCNNISFVEDMFVHYMQRPRVTLGNKFYDNFFDLKLMAIDSIEKLLLHWKIQNEIVNENRLSSEFSALKSVVRLLSNADNYNMKEKKDYLKKLFKKDKIKIVLKSVRLLYKKDKLIRFLMKTKNYQVLLKLYQNK